MRSFTPTQKRAGGGGKSFSHPEGGGGGGGTNNFGVVFTLSQKVSPNKA